MGNNIQKIFNNNFVKNIIITMIYALITFILVLHHEIWADEAQVWLIIKNLSFFDLFKHLVNEGHPSFFYLLMMPFAKAGMPIFFMQIFCWLTMVGSVFLLLKYSPFHGFTKFAIITSAGFLYFFPVIARSYSILPILIFLAAILYKKQKEHPILYACILAMIANTHIIMFIFVFILGCFFVYDNLICPRKIRDKKQSDVNEFFKWRLEKVSNCWLRSVGSNYNTRLDKSKLTNKSYITAAGIIGLSLLAVIIQLNGTIASNGSIGFSFENIYSSCIKVLVQFFSNSIDYFSAIQLSIKIMPEYANIYFATSILFAILFFVLLILIFLKSKRLFYLTFFSISFQLAIYIFAYPNIIYPNRNFCAFLILIFCCWLILDRKFTINKQTTNLVSQLLPTQHSQLILNSILSIFLLLTIINGINFATKDWKYNYSSAKETAEFIDKNISKDAVIIPTLDAFGLAVYAFANEHKFYSVTTHKEIKYNVWLKTEYYFKENFEELFTDIVKNEIKNNNFENKEIYILATDFLMSENFFEKYYPEKYKTIYKSKPCLAAGESFTIYKYKPNGIK